MLFRKLYYYIRDFTIFQLFKVSILIHLGSLTKGRIVFNKINHELSGKIKIHVTDFRDEILDYLFSSSLLSSRVEAVFVACFIKVSDGFSLRNSLSLCPDKFAFCYHVIFNILICCTLYLNCYAVYVIRLRSVL